MNDKDSNKDPVVVSVPWESGDTDVEIPEIGDIGVLPGGTRWGFLNQFSPKAMLGDKEDLWDFVRCADLRKRLPGQKFFDWAERNYTWGAFLRDVNHVSRPEAEALATLLFSRDVLAEDHPGGMLSGLSASLKEHTGANSVAEFWVTWLRISNRYAYYNRLLSADQPPDPLYDPPPPLRLCASAKSDDVFKRHVQPYLREVFFQKGHSRTLDVVSQAILYVFGFIPNKPDGVDGDLWKRAVEGLFGPHKPLYHMLRVPGEYLNNIALDEQSGLAGFFPTPMNVTKMMGMMMQLDQIELIDRSGFYRWPGDTPESRIEKLMEAKSDCCVGTGNMLVSMLNTTINAQFIDINMSMVLATRAFCAMYSPWLVNNTFRENALIAPDTLASAVDEQYRKYTCQGMQAHLGFYYHGIQMAEAHLQGMDEDALKQNALKVSHIQARANARSYQKTYGRSKDMVRQLMLLMSEARANEPDEEPVGSVVEHGDNGHKPDEVVEELPKEKVTVPNHGAVQLSLFQ